MLIGIDTSGKIGQLPIGFGAVKLVNSGILDEIKTKAGKRKKILTRRRRIKAADLVEEEIEYSVSRINMPKSSTLLKSEEYRILKDEHYYIKDWKFKLLASCIHYIASDITNEHDVVLIDKDYGLEQMKNLCHHVERLFVALDKKHITVDIGTSYNEVIGLADLIAGACKRNHCHCSKELRLEEIDKRMDVFRHPH
ncbi:Uncharacterised protein [uncultured archaeon]|nr:Uncharacterised protein [uncultured archaeon]